jgi:hypothetical protein
MGPALRRYAPIWAGATLCALAVSSAWAQGGAADTTDQATLSILRDLMRTWALYGEIQVLEQANRIGLTSEQAERCATAIAKPFAELRRIRELEASEPLRQALAEIRETLLRGGEPTEAHWIAVHAATVGRLAPGGAAEDGDEVLERRKAELADQVAMAIAGVLTEEQLARLSSSEPEEIAGSIAEELAELRAAAPDEWNAFRSEAISNLRQTFAEVAATPEEKVFEDVGAFLDGVRAMNTDTYFARQDELMQEMVALVSAGQALTAEARRMRAINSLGEWAEVWTLMELLQEMAAAQRHFVLQ